LSSEVPLYVGWLNGEAYGRNWRSYTIALVGSRVTDTMSPAAYVPVFNWMDPVSGDEVTLYVWFIRVEQQGSTLALEHRVVPVSGTSETVIEGLDREHNKTQLLDIWAATPLIGDVKSKGGRPPGADRSDDDARPAIVPRDVFVELIKKWIYPSPALHGCKDLEFAQRLSRSGERWTRDRFALTRKEHKIQLDDIRNGRL